MPDQARMTNGAIGLPRSVLRVAQPAAHDYGRRRDRHCGRTLPPSARRVPAAEPAGINTLLAAPEQLRLASDYVHAVVDDLDERRPVAATGLHGVLGRSEERRVGKECRSRWS